MFSLTLKNVKLMPRSRPEKLFLLSTSPEELDFPNDYVELLFAYQRIDENHLHPRHFEEALELHFKEDKLDGLIYWLTGFRNEIAITEIERKSFPTLAPIRHQRYLVPNELGDHVLGGDVPVGLKMPIFQEAFTIYYLGHVGVTDFPVLPFRNLHLFVPELLTNVLFVDYKNPNQPVVYNEEVIDKVNVPDRAQPFTIHTFDPIRFSVVDISNEQAGFELGISGVPNWLQQIEIPKCPKSGRHMQFLLQIDTQHDDYPSVAEKYYVYLTPTLYVFIEPETKMVAYLYQTT